VFEESRVWVYNFATPRGVDSTIPRAFLALSVQSRSSVLTVNNLLMDFREAKGRVACDRLFASTDY
jgi:hypothetical protein